MGAVAERFVCFVILQRMTDLVGGDGDRRQGAAVELVRGQPDRFFERVVVIPLVRLFHLHAVHAVTIEQVPGQLGAGTRIAVVRSGITGQHPLDPDAGQEDDGHDDEAEDRKRHA